MLRELIAERQPALCKEDAKQVVMAEIIRPPFRWKATDKKVQTSSSKARHGGE
jgi:hypothetical protein